MSIQTTYSAWQIHPSHPKSWRSTESISNLHLATNLPKPTPGPNTALVRIHAAALNARDMMVVAHDPVYPINTIPNLTTGADGAGIVEAVGEGSVWKVGQRVLLLPNAWIEGEAPTLEGLKTLGAGDVEGTLREYAVVNDDLLIPGPSNLSYEETAAVSAAGGTAMNALFFGSTTLKKGMTVLTQGTGGVSCFAIQLASAAGATVIATSSSDSKLAIAKTLGATHLINYTTTPSWATEVLRLTAGVGVDHVIDVAGAGTIEQSLRATKQGGLISAIGFLSGSKEVDMIPEVIFGAKTVRGVFSMRKDMMEAMVRFVEEKEIRPRIARDFGWGEVREAFGGLVGMEGVGKIVVRVGGD